MVIGILSCRISTVARVSVNHDGKGGTAPNPLVWDQGSRPKVRKLAIRVNVDLASLPGPPGFLNSSWIQVDAGCITGSDIDSWPDSVGILVRFTSFLNTLHWPAGSADLGHFGVSFLELLILFEQWAGHRLLSEKVTRPHVRSNRPAGWILLIDLLLHCLALFKMSGIYTGRSLWWFLRMLCLLLGMLYPDLLWMTCGLFGV